MKIGVFRYRGRSVERKPRWEAGVGSLAANLDGILYGHADAYNKKLDYALMVCSKKELEWLAIVGKSPNWGKLIGLPCSGGWEFNDAEYMELLRRAQLDAFIVPPGGRLGMLQLLTIPLIEYCYPYDVTPIKVEKRQKILLYIKNIRDINTNFMSTLAVYKKLTKIPAVVTTNPASKYRDDAKTLREIINKFGLDDRLEVIDSLPREEYLKTIAECKVAVDMDNRNVWGRNVLDAITTRTICVGTWSTYQEMFFKDYMVNTVDDAVGNVMAAINNPFPHMNLNRLKPENAIRELEEKLSRI